MASRALFHGAEAAGCGRSGRALASRGRAAAEEVWPERGVGRARDACLAAAAAAVQSAAGLHPAAGGGGDLVPRGVGGCGRHPGGRGH